jgi:hypothetical protein
LQETRRVGKNEFIEDGYTFLGSEPDAQHGRGSCGVGILLSSTATESWKASDLGSLHIDFGPRGIAVWMLVLDPTPGKHLCIFMISAYAPSSDASNNDQLIFENVFSSAISRRNLGDILVICADANASLDLIDPKRNDADIYTTVGRVILIM